MKFKVITVALALSWSSYGVSEVLGNNGLFLEVWDGNNKSYIKDLGIKLTDFMTAPGCYNKQLADLSTDSELATLGDTLPGTAVWSVQAVNQDTSGAGMGEDYDPQSPTNRIGILTTVTDPENELFDPNQFFSISDATQAMTQHLANAAVSVTTSKAFADDQAGYYFEPDFWDDRMKTTVGFASNKPIGESMKMYFLTADVDLATGIVGNNSNPFGDWTFDGKHLSFSTTASKPATCPNDNNGGGDNGGGDNGGGNNGGGDNGGGNNGGGNNGGGDNGGGNNGGGNNGGGNNGGGNNGGGNNGGTSGGTVSNGLRMLFPKAGDTLKVGVRHSIGWVSDSIPIKSKTRLGLYFSRDAGVHWRLVKNGLRSTGYYLWKPNRRRVTPAGLLAVCVPQTKISLAKCATTDGAFVISR